IVLLADGWEDLQDVAQEFTENLLGFIRLQEKSVVILATSRPYGAGRPSVESGFEIYYIKPLLESQIIKVVTNFYSRRQPTLPQNRTNRFMNALKDPKVKELAIAVKPLLMMLSSDTGDHIPD